MQFLLHSERHGTLLSISFFVYVVNMWYQTTFYHTQKNMRIGLKMVIVEFRLDGCFIASIYARKLHFLPLCGISGIR